MSAIRILSALLLGMVALVCVVWLPPTASAAAVSVDYRAAKGFVTAKTDRSLTVLASNGRVLVVITNTTRILGLRGSFAEIIQNDVVRAEGRWTAANSLLADRVEVVFVADGMKVQRPPSTPTIELLTIKI